VREPGAWRKFIAGWKSAYTTYMPSYHTGNEIGNRVLAWMADVSIRSWMKSGRMMRVVRGRGAFERSAAAGRGVKYEDTLSDADRELLKEAELAEKHGALRSGLHNEITHNRGQQPGRGRRFSERRESQARLSVWIEARKQGLSPDEAADMVNKFLIDYGDLTQFERRALRRLSGFYTWTARSIPLHAEQLITKPGKYANVEKLRQNIGNATTDQTEQERQQGMTDAVLKGYPFVVGKRAIGLGLSQTLLNEFPTAPTPEGMKAWKEELDKFAWGNLNPIPRAIIESRTGRNVVTKAEIENEQRPLVSAPAWVQYLPEALKKPLGVTPPKGKGQGGQGFTDPKTGRASWAWNGKKDWAYDQLMLGFIGQAAAVANSGRSQATKEQAIGSIVGAKIDPLDKVMTERASVQAGRADLTALKRARGVLNQQGINADHPTPEWRRLNEAINKAEPKAKKPKAKKPGGGFGKGTASGSSNFGKGTASQNSKFGKGGF
jgi:hypothetical protein